MGFNLVEEVRNRGGVDEGARTTVVELGWWLGFGFKVKLAWGCVGQLHACLYRGVGVVQIY
jgi:hypothetical protein